MAWACGRGQRRVRSPRSPATPPTVVLSRVWYRQKSRGRDMKIRTLIANQRYFGLEPLTFSRGAARTFERVTKLPPERARVSAQTLGKDFELDSTRAQALLETFVTKGLLQGQGCPIGEYRLTDLFKE